LAECEQIEFPRRDLPLTRTIVHAMNRLAVQGRQPEDKGFPFPEYACHGGGESSRHDSPFTCCRGAETSLV